jgi:hypothetical protein
MPHLHGDPDEPMRWFTHAWHCGDVTDEESDASIADYLRHLDRLVAGAPGTIGDLARVNLHDGQVQEWQLADKAFRWLLLVGDLQVGYRLADIEYLDADIAGVDAADLTARRLDQGQLEIISDELDRAEEGFELRLYFSDDSVLVIRFGDVRVSCSEAEAHLRR